MWIYFVWNAGGQLDYCSSHKYCAWSN